MERDTTMTSPSDNVAARCSKRKIIITVQVLLVLVIVFVLIQSLSAPPPVEMPSAPGNNTASVAGSGGLTPSSDVPQKIGGLSLLNVLTGQRAIDDMSELHGKDVGIVGGWVGHYQARATAWVGETTDDQVASGLLGAMVRRIGGANGPFRDLRNKEIDGQKLYSVTGLGQNHYFYQRGNKVIWLAMPSANEDAFLRDALNLIN